MILRSRTPDGVYQEAWGYLCVHYALRALIHTAADHNDIDPDRVSFTKALHAARRSVRTGLTATVNLATAIGRATNELLRFNQGVMHVVGHISDLDHFGHDEDGNSRLSIRAIRTNDPTRDKDRRHGL